tara:strand:- start:1049 stop:2266 length:1218 start_codon:yes stop_codon:yes gene_type:complete
LVRNSEEMLNRNIQEFLWSFITFNINAKEIFYNLNEVEIIQLLEYIEKSRLEGRFISFLNSSDLIKDIDSNNLVYAKIKRQAQENSIRALILLDKSIQISRELAKRRVNHVFLKGLNPLFTGKKFSERTIRDIDLLVSPTEINEVSELLQEIGFNFLNKFQSKKGIRIYPENSKYNFRMKNSDGILLELHYRILINSKETQCKLSREILNLGNNSPQKILPNMKDLFLMHLIYHGTTKNYFDVGPSFIFDIAFLLDEHRYDLRKISALSESFGLEKEFKIIIDLLRSKNKDLFTCNNEFQTPIDILNLSEEVMLLEPLNKKIIQVTLSKGFISKITHFRDLLFVSKYEVMQEFQLGERNKFLPFFYFLRWLRQFKSFFFLFFATILRSSARNRSKKLEYLLDYLS